jgi:RimJ/RimL family protein N-acetyltransferase
MLIPKEMQNPEGARKGLEILIQSYASTEPIFALTIADSHSDEFLGFCQLWPCNEPKTLELVYAVLPRKQGLGIATEAAKAVSRHALSNAEVDNVIAFMVPENAASVKVVEKLGFLNEGPAIHHSRASIRFRAGKEWVPSSPS